MMIIGQHSFPDGDTWAVAGVGIVFWIFTSAKMLGGRRTLSAAADEASPEA
jgi:hypothetical protein